MAFNQPSRPSPIRVLHVLGSLERGGAELRTLDVMRRLDPEEFQLDFCAVSGRAGPLDGEVRRLGGSVHLVPIKTARFPERFSRLLRTGRYDVVHSHVHTTSGMILWLAARAKVKLRIAHFRNTHDGRAQHPMRLAWQSVMKSLMRRHATHVIGVCEATLEAAWSRNWAADSRCQAIYNGLEPARFQCAGEGSALRAEWGVPEDARVYLHIGRTAPQKNHRRVLRIFAELVRRDPSCWLVLVGRGTNDPAGDIAWRRRTLGLDQRVVLLGERDDVPRLVHAADALLLPSLWEGLPGVVLEACAAGLPVLASDLPGVREIASRLRLVRSLSLDASDAEWAASALELPGEAERIRLRDGAASAFRASVFHIDRAVEAHCAMWRRAAGNGHQ